MDNSDSNRLLDFEKLHYSEYVEANGLGGYASGTFSGAHSRKYHGLLVASLHPPVKRTVVVSKMDESIELDGELFELGCNQFPGALHPFGVQYLASYQRDLFPEWIYKLKGITLKKTIAAVYGENTTLVLYEVLEAESKFNFFLQPFYASRDIHHLSWANDQIGQHYIFDKGMFQTMNYQGCPEFFISVPRAQFVEGRAWYRNFEYQHEFLRGMDFREDLFTHGKFMVSLRKGNRLGIIVSLEKPEGRDAFKLFKEEKKRRETLMSGFSYHQPLKRLALAADQFIVKREDLNTIIAGYPWFADWGRDTMIALPGLCLVTGRLKEAKRILQKFSEYVKDGMIPNRFPDSGEFPEYNTIDATLWFYYAIYKYYQYSNDKLFLKSLIPVLRDIIDWHFKGTWYNIHVDQDDNLLSGGVEGVQLTWMDAKIGDWVVTPRRGKAVEINALWYNALCCMEFFLKELNYHGDAEFFQQKAQLVKRSFNESFWNVHNDCLYDYIEGSFRSEDIRPNQIYALSLPFAVLDREKAVYVLKVVQDHLLTPRGLRSLSPAHSEYREQYQGSPHERDASYHQGPVWSHLIGAYIDALYFAFDEQASPDAQVIISRMFENLDEAGLGSISEIFDGVPPHKPRGCIAQAWSVAEVLRVSVERNLFTAENTVRASAPAVESLR